MKNTKIGLRILAGFLVIILVMIGITIMIFTFNTNAINRLTAIDGLSQLLRTFNTGVDDYNLSKANYKVVEISIDDEAYANFMAQTDHVKQVMNEVQTAGAELEDMTATLPLVAQLITNIEEYQGHVTALQNDNLELSKESAVALEAGLKIENLLLEKAKQNASLMPISEMFSKVYSQHISYLNNYDQDVHYTPVELQFNAVMTTLKTMAGEPELKKLAETYAPAMQTFHEANMSSYLVIEASDASQAKIDALISQLTTEVSAIVDQKVDFTRNNAKTALLAIMIVMAFIIVVSIAIAQFLAKGITRPIKKMIVAAQKIALGDIQIDAEYDSKDEVGQLASAFSEMIDSIKVQVAFVENLATGDLSKQIDVRSENDVMNTAINDMIDKMNDTFHGIAQSTRMVLKGSMQIADGAQNLAAGSQEQAASISQLNNIVQDLTDSSTQSSRMSKDAQKLSENVMQSARHGEGQMQQMIEAVTKIDESSNDIAKVIQVIDDIAFQTNILALNASVEAARAGQHGKGFAVVAEEVRNLATKSGEAAKNISVLIDSSLERTKAGTEIARDTSENFDKIVGGINESVELIGKVVAASESQKEQSDSITFDIENISRVVGQNSSTAEESAASSEELSSQCSMLDQMIASFKLKD